MDFFDELIELEKAMIHGADPLQVMIEALWNEGEEPPSVPAVDYGFLKPDPGTEIVKMLQGETNNQAPVNGEVCGLHEPDSIPKKMLEELVEVDTKQLSVSNECCDLYGPDPLHDIVNMLLGETVHPQPVPHFDAQLLCSTPPTVPAWSVVDLQPQPSTANLCSQQDQHENGIVPSVMFPPILLENLIPVTTVNGEAFTPAFLPSAPLLNIPTTQRRKTYRQQHEKEQKPYIKKPPNAFMLFRQEQRSNIVAELKVANCAVVNIELGKRWRCLPEQKKLKYFQEADKLRHHHEQMYPEWSTSDNYGKKRKRVRRKCPTPTTVLLDPTA